MNFLTVFVPVILVLWMIVPVVVIVKLLTVPVVVLVLCGSRTPILLHVLAWLCYRI